MSCNIQLNIDNNRVEILNYNFNYDYTTFEDLLEYVSFLFPNYNFCHCFKFFYYNGNQWLPIENEDKISSVIFNNSLNLTLSHGDNLCTCNPLLKESFKKTKKQIIFENLDTIKKLEKIIDNLNHKINNLIKEKDNQISKNIDLKEEKNKYKMKKNTLSKDKEELEKMTNEQRNKINGLNMTVEKQENLINEKKNTINGLTKTVEEQENLINEKKKYN